MLIIKLRAAIGLVIFAALILSWLVTPLHTFRGFGDALGFVLFFHRFNCPAQSDHITVHILS